MHLIVLSVDYHASVNDYFECTTSRCRCRTAYKSNEIASLN